MATVMDQQSHFTTLVDLIRDWDTAIVPDESFTIGSQERLRSLLRDWKENDIQPGPGDLAGLIRHVLRREQLIRGGDPSFRVPLESHWPTIELWESSGLSVLESGDTALLKAGNSWCPQWLVGSERHPPLHDAFRETQQRKESGKLADLRVDPAISETFGDAFRRYTSEGQREAVRGAFIIHPGATLVVNLPTGSGKSLAGWAPALIGPSGQRVTIVIVPTTALAIDQEKSLKNILAQADGIRLPERLAYHSGLSDQEHKDFRDRIANGSQTILFTSPEALLKSLLISVYKANRSGFLKYFIIDEAHLVASWGNGFRPEFQGMTGLWRDLIQQMPAERQLRTLLLTATLTSDTFETLKTCFRGPNGFDVVSASHLRPEPSWWISRASNPDEKDSRVRECIRFLPRPFILYCTKPEDAKRWYRQIKEMKIHRVGCVYGGVSSTKKGEEIIEKWQNNQLDVIVATSAFGLGMDKSDVRAVLHACVPETLDRYYQEVGRTGRDGRACVSVLIYTNDDLRTAEHLNSETLIGVPKGLARWKAMHNTSEGVGEEDNMRVSLNSRPPFQDAENDANRSWNVRTLTLMARAGLIAFNSKPPESLSQEQGESDEAFQARKDQAFDEYFESCIVTIKNRQHLNRNEWDKRFEEARLGTGANDAMQMNKLREVLDGQKEVSTILKDIYSFEFKADHDEEWIDLNVTPVCGGCSVCRLNANEDDTGPFYHPPQSTVVRNPIRTLKPHLYDYLDRRCHMFIAYSRPKKQREKDRHKRDIINNVLVPLVQNGIYEIICDDAWLDERDYRQLFDRAETHFVIHRNWESLEKPGAAMDDESMKLPRVAIYEPERPREIPDSIYRKITTPPTLILFPADTPDFDRTDRRFVDVHSTISLQAFKNRLKQ